MACLFDTDAISEASRPRPAMAYLRWLRALPRSDQFTSAVVIGELFKGAFRSSERDRHLERIERRVLPAVTVLPYDIDTARVYGRIHAILQAAGRNLSDADLQIAATAIHHDLELVTGNLRHFQRVPGLKINPVLAQARG